MSFYPLRLAFLVLGPVLFWHAYRTPLAWRADRLAQWVALLTLAWGAVGLVWSPDPAYGFRTLVILATGLTVTLWAVRYVRGIEARLQRALLAWVAFATLTAMFGFVEIWRGQYLFVNVDAGKLAGIERFADRLGWLPPRVFNVNWNSFAFTNSLGAMTFLGVALTPRIGALRPWAFAVALLQLLLIGSSASRAAVAGVAVSITVFAILLLLRRLRLRLLAAILASLGFLSLVVFLVRAGIARYFGILLAFLELKSRGQEALGSRGDLYRAAVEAMIGSLGFGRGLGASATVLAGNRVTAYHHHFMEIGAELGVVVLAAHLVMHVVIAVQLYAARHHPRWGSLALAMTATHLALPVLLMGPSGVFVEPVFWLWLGLSAAAAVTLRPGVDPALTGVVAPTSPGPR